MHMATSSSVVSLRPSRVQCSWILDDFSVRWLSSTKVCTSALSCSDLSRTSGLTTYSLSFSWIMVMRCSQPLHRPVQEPIGRDDGLERAHFDLHADCLLFGKFFKCFFQLWRNLEWCCSGITGDFTGQCECAQHMLKY